MNDVLDILLVVENEVSRKNLLDRLNTQGYSAKTPSGGFHTLASLEESKCKIVVIIGNMADMPGFEIINLIRSAYTKEVLPILYISARKTEDQDEQEEITLSGANSFLTRESSIDDLLEEISRLIS